MMTIHGDYLWDKTGEPDPEVQELEELLGALRYRPKPLDIPAGLQVGRERSFFRDSAPRLAIAATIVMLLLGLGVWLGLQRLQRNRAPELAKSKDGLLAKPDAIDQSTLNPDQNAVVASPNKIGLQPTEGPVRLEVNQSQLAANPNRAGHFRVKNQQLIAARRQEAEAAKDQLMLAFRMVSVKLNFAQKKAQEMNQKEPVHNQHKIG
jgi:hypothetical protein